MSGSPSNAGEMLDVTRLNMNMTAMAGQIASVVKLTDESAMALQKAQQARMPVRLKFDGQNGCIEIGVGERIRKFRFILQQLSGDCSDAVMQDRELCFCTVASVRSKIQLQTTEKALVETREKAQKYAAEEKKRTMKEEIRQRQIQRPITVRKATNPLAIGAQKPSSSINKNVQHETTKNGSLKVANNSAPSNASVADARSLVRAELSRRPLRKRVIHLVLLGRYHNTDEIINQLQKDTPNGESSPDEVSKVRDLVDEVSETGKDTGRLHLKPMFYNEIDHRWPGLTSDEKAYVRRIMSGNLGTTNFAPTRKSGIAPVLAPTPSLHSNSYSSSPSDAGNQSRHISSLSIKKSSPEQIPSNGTAKKVAHATLNNVNTDSVTGTVSDKADKVTVANSTQKRKIPNSVASAVPTKRNRLCSLSPPEDPSNANQQQQQSSQTAQKTVPNRPESNNQSTNNADLVDKVITSANSSSVTPPVDSPAASKDWSKEFSEIRSLAEAENYYNLFLDDYPTYIECYKKLCSIASEFKTLEKQLTDTPKNTREYEKVEKSVLARFQHYQRDSDFQCTRQKHSELRSKLELLKKRIASWESKNTKTLQSSSVSETRSNARNKNC